MKENKYFSVVVVYNQLVENSLTCNNLKNIKGHNIDVIILDNSTIEVENESYCKKNQWMYMSMGGNVGLSKAYNKALDMLKEKDGVVIWFDDDTNITQEYFDELDNKVNSKLDVDIFAPVIYGQDDKIYSPNESRFFKNKQLKNPSDKINFEKFNAINSCTAVRLSVYKDYRYDERIFLDQVDHNFFEDQRNLKRKFCKMDTVIHHNFSLKSKQATPKQCWKRYEIMIPDYVMFCSKTRARLCLGMIKVLGWGVREAINYKYPLFIWWCWKKSFYEIKHKHLF